MPSRQITRSPHKLIDRHELRGSANRETAPRFPWSAPPNVTAMSLSSHACTSGSRLVLDEAVLRVAPDGVDPGPGPNRQPTPALVVRPPISEQPHRPFVPALRFVLHPQRRCAEVERGDRGAGCPPVVGDVDDVGRPAERLVERRRLDRAVEVGEVLQRVDGPQGVHRERAHTRHDTIHGCSKLVRIRIPVAMCGHDLSPSGGPATLSWRRSTPVTRVG